MEDYEERLLNNKKVHPLLKKNIIFQEQLESLKQDKESLIKYLEDKITGEIANANDPLSVQYGRGRVNAWQEVLDFVNKVKGGI